MRVFEHRLLTGRILEFIMGLEKDYPSTVSTITRTCAKLVSKDESVGTCPICQRYAVDSVPVLAHETQWYRPVQGGLDTWKSRISIRSLTEVAPAQPAQEPPSNSPVTLLCYSCQGTLTSRSSKSVLTSENGVIVSLPVWTQEKLMDRERMKGEIQEFLLDHDSDE